jgi:hypothetical protein
MLSVTQGFAGGAGVDAAAAIVELPVKAAATAAETSFLRIVRMTQTPLGRALA